MIEQRDSAAWFKLNGLIRSFMAHGGTSPFGRVLIVSEFPKSGGTWLSQMLSEILKLPFPRNRLPPLGECLLHGHLRSDWNVRDQVLMWRDGRDVMVSHYFHSVFLHGDGKGPLGQDGRALAFRDPSDIQANLPTFIDYMFTGRHDGRRSWSGYVDYWVDNSRAVHTSYEALSADTVGELRRVLQMLGHSDADAETIESVVEAFSFRRQADRETGDDKPSSFLRKGVVGDWKNHFSQEACSVFHGYAGNQLIRLGYESDDSWVSSVC